MRKTKRVSKKASPKAKAITVPELRRAFEHIHTFLHKRPSTSAFRKEWKKVFGTELSEKAAADYLAFESKAKAKGTQKGGSAPLAYDMTMPTGPTPSVPAYVAGGMGLPADSVYQTCGNTSGKNEFLPPPVSMGSNDFQKGGKRTRKKQKGGSISSALSEFMQRPFSMASPPGMGNDAMMLSKGYNEFSSPRPEINPTYGLPPPSVYTAGILPVSKMF